MQAVCVTADRKLEVRDVPEPDRVPPEHLLIEMQAAAINHGDKSFLANPGVAGSRATDRMYDIWGASAAGKVRATGAGLPSELEGRMVAVYRSLSKSEHTVGLWSEQVLVPRTSCVLLPDGLSAGQYSGALVNAITGYAFLEQMAIDGQKGVLVTAGSSATGRAMAALSRQRGVPAIFLTRSEQSAEKLRAAGVEHVMVTNGETFLSELESLAAKLSITAVFDGAGGELTSRIVPKLPMYSAINLYGFLDAAVPLTISSLAIMAKNLTLKRFSNFASPTVSEPQKLAAAISNLEGVIGDPLFHTIVGEEFAFYQIDQAMAYEGKSGNKAVLVPGTTAA